MARPKSPLLSRERIINEASNLISESGLASLTTRKLAERLGVRGPSIYNYFDTMDEIQDAVVDSVLLSVPIADLERHGWREGISKWGLIYWQVLAENAELVPLLARGPSTRRSQLRLANALYGCLVRGGWPKRAATEIAIAIRSYISGAALAPYSGGFSEAAETYSEEFGWLTEAPKLRHMQDEIRLSSFQRGLRTFIDGLTLQHMTEVAGRIASSDTDVQ